MKSLQFKKWLTENDKTINYRDLQYAPPASKQAAPTPGISPEKTSTYPPGYQPLVPIATININNIIKYIEQNIDEFIYVRDKNNVNLAQASFEGTLEYSPPEEQEKITKYIYERNDDIVIDALQRVAQLVPYAKPMVQRSGNYWLQFKKNLINYKYYENTKHENTKVVNPVLWQASKYGLLATEKAIGGLNRLLRKPNLPSNITEPYSKFINIWSQNYPTWLQIVENEEERAKKEYRWGSTKVDMDGEKFPDLW